MAIWKRPVRYATDLLLVVLAGCAAVVLREGWDGLADIGPNHGLLIAASVAIAAAVVPLTGLDRSVWRFTGFEDLKAIGMTSLAIALGPLALMAAFGQLASIDLAHAGLQSLLAGVFLVIVRLSMRWRHARRHRLRRPQPLAADLLADNLSPHATVLVVGVSPLTELYLKSVQEFSPGRVHVAGILAIRREQVGRRIHDVPVIATIEDLPETVSDLKLKGIRVDTIVIGLRGHDLTPSQRAWLGSLSAEDKITTVHLAHSLGLDPDDANSGPPGRVMPLSIAPSELGALSRRPYWTIKRGLDVLGALVLLLLLAPVMAVVAVLVAVDIGRPVLFLQSRPGLGGRIFKVCKFRTMTSVHRRSGSGVSIDQSSSSLCRFLRKSRLDELPQLWNILMGDMSFIGPRPLLPHDQPATCRARLLVRPGITGLVQVSGGRALTAEHKASLDVAYIRTASLRLDAQILARTVKMVLYGEPAEADETAGAADRITGAPQILQPASVDRRPEVRPTAEALGWVVSAHGRKQETTTGGACATELRG